MSSWHIREAVRRIADGGVIAYPTETVYGLGCDPFNATAVLHLLRLKQRDPGQGLILVASDFQQLEPLLLPLPAAARRRVSKAAVTPTSWILPCADWVPTWLRGKHRSLAVRISTHPTCRALCDRWGGPLVSTSANLHGHPAARNPLDIARAFHGRLDYVVHSPVAGSGHPSRIRDGLSGKVLRAHG